jgi:hypothetical protein
VLVAQVDHVQPKSPQGAVDRSGEVLGAQHPAARLPFDGIDVRSELGGDHDLVGVGPEGFADEFLTGVRTVDLGGVENVTSRSTAR